MGGTPALEERYRGTTRRRVILFTFAQISLCRFAHFGALMVIFSLAFSGSVAAQDVRREMQPGIAVDSRGGAVIDPTKNVLDLVLAAVKRLDDLSAAFFKRQDDMREMETRFQNSMREAESRRLNELADQKQKFDLELARILKSNVDSSSLLLATQLAEVKRDLSERTTKLEQFRYESSGTNAGRGDVFGWVAAAFFAITTMVSLVMAYMALQKARTKP